MMTYCNKCGHQFKMKQSKVKQRPLEGDIVETYFQCPKCEVIFRVCLTDSDIRQKQKEFNERLKEMEVRIDRGQLVDPEYLRETWNLQSLIKISMDTLNKKVR